MSAENHIIDLALTLGYPESCTRIIAGAGVNAGSSSMNLNYPASDSMAELVWSPLRGPTVMRTLPSFPEKRPFLLWNVGPSNGDPSSSLRIRCSENDGDDDDNIVADGKDQMVLSRRAQNEAEARDLADDKPGTTAGLGLSKFAFQCFPDSSLNLNKEIPSDVSQKNNEAFISSLIQEEGWLAAKAPTSPMVLSRYPGTEEAKDGNEEDSGENDPLQISKKYAQQKQNKGRYVRASSVPLGSHSRLLRKGTNRALSEGNVDKRRFLDREDIESKGSVESCHSACMLGKRIWNSTDEFMLESKRVKTGVDVNFASTSIIKRNNSFMLYLSNMVKGFSEVNDDEGPSPDLTLPQSSNEGKSRNKGFQTVFKSLYSPSTKLPEVGTTEMQSDKFVQDDIVGKPDLILSKLSPIKDNVKINPKENKNGCSSSASQANHGATGGMMWISRLTAKARDNSVKMVMPKRDDCIKLSNKGANETSGSLVGSAKEMDTFASNTESSLGSKNIHGYGYQSAESSHKSRTSEAMASTFARRLDVFKHILSTESETEGNKQNDLEDEVNRISTSEHLSLPLMNLASSGTADVPSGVFDAVSQLQVSRASMQKWIESDESMSELEGLFLRLRLGKWEEGLGGTGYYVARISAEQSGELSEDGKKSISVNVGGLKCLVGSQYISNNDFLEDEVVVWWCRTLKTGGVVPSKEDLDANLRRRIALGL